MSRPLNDCIYYIVIDSWNGWFVLFIIIFM